MTDAATAASARPPRGLSYNQVRILLLVGGLILLALTAGVNYVRRVETAEVAAILFFIPIFVAFVFWDWQGGLIAAAGAIAGYVALRYGAIHAIGAGRFTGLIFSRSIAFLAFGETMGPMQLAGGALVLSAVLTLNIRRVRSARVAHAPA